LIVKSIFIKEFEDVSIISPIPYPIDFPSSFLIFIACFNLSHLELVLVTSEGGALFLPEIVRLDDVGHVDERVAVLLQHLEDGFDRAPGGTPHVHHHCKPQLALLLAEISNYTD